MSIQKQHRLRELLDKEQAGDLSPDEMKERVDLCVQLAPMLLSHCEQFAGLVQSTVEAYQAAHPVVMSLFDDIYEKELHEKFPMFQDAAEEFEGIGVALGIFEDEDEDEDGAGSSGGRGEVDDDDESGDDR